MGMHSCCEWKYFAVVIGLALVVSSSNFAVAQPPRNPVQSPAEPAAPPRIKVDPTHPLADALEAAYASRESLKDVKDYQGVFSRREIVGGTPKAQTCNIKFRRDPFSVYLFFHKPNEGREAIYVEGQNKNMIQVHETGFASLVGTVSIDPNGPQAKADSRHPITNIGIHNLLEKVIRQWEAESQFGEVEVKFYREAKLGKETECVVIESIHPTPRNQFRFHKTRLYLDKKLNIPIRVEQFAFPGPNDREAPLVEEYTYTNLRLNPGLRDVDFNVANPAYKFQ